MIAIRLKQQDWAWREVAARIDTEGSLDPVKPALSIAKLELALLLSLQKFLSEEGFRVKPPEQQSTGVYYLRLCSARDMKRLMGRTEQFLRTKEKRELADGLVRRPVMRKGRWWPMGVPFDPKFDPLTRLPDGKGRVLAEGSRLTPGGNSVDALKYLFTKKRAFNPPVHPHS